MEALALADFDALKKNVTLNELLQDSSSLIR